MFCNSGHCCILYVFQIKGVPLILKCTVLHIFAQFRPNCEKICNTVYYYISPWLKWTVLIYFFYLIFFIQLMESIGECSYQIRYLVLLSSIKQNKNLTGMLIFIWQWWVTKHTTKNKIPPLELISTHFVIMFQVSEKELTSRTWFAKVPEPQFKQTNNTSYSRYWWEFSFRIVFTLFLMMFDVAEEEPTSRTWFHA